MKARLFNRKGFSIEYRRLEDLKPNALPPEVIVMNNYRAFMRYDIHPLWRDPSWQKAMDEAIRQLNEDGIVGYIEVSCAWTTEYKDS